jgi:hypothetical protein
VGKAAVGLLAGPGLGLVLAGNPGDGIIQGAVQLLVNAPDEPIDQIKGKGVVPPRHAGGDGLSPTKDLGISQDLGLRLIDG